MKNNQNKVNLATAAELSGYTMGELFRDEPVSLKVMIRLCKIFHSDVGGFGGDY